MMNDESKSVRLTCLSGCLLSAGCSHSIRTQAAQTHVTRCNVIYVLTFGEAERDL